MEWAHLLFLVVSLLHSCAYAQAGIISTPSLGFTLRDDNLKETMSVMLVAFFSAFIFMGFFSLYLRHCTHGSGANRNPIAAASDLCSGGCNRQIIDKCPVLVYSTVKDLKIGKGNLECAVCLNEFQDYDNLRLLPKCHHVFHLDCIDTWLLSHMNCPVCRTKLTSDVDDIVITIPTTTPELEQQQQQQQQQQQMIMEEPQSSEVAVITGEEREPDSAVVEETIIPSRESRMLDKFPRSHSTGHSLVEESEENVKVLDRYTLRLPEHVRKQILVNHGKVLTSDVVMPGAWSAKRVWYRSNNNVEGWSLSMTPPLVSLGFGSESGRTCWTPLRMSFHRVQGTQKSSPIPPV